MPEESTHCRTGNTCDPFRLSGDIYYIEEVRLSACHHRYRIKGIRIYAVGSLPGGTLYHK